MPVLLIVYSAGLDRELHARFVVIENIVAEVFVVGVNIGQIEIRMTETVPQAGRIILVRFDRRIVRRCGIHIRFGAISIRGSISLFSPVATMAVVSPIVSAAETRKIIQTERIAPAWNSGL